MNTCVTCRWFRKENLGDEVIESPRQKKYGTCSLAADRVDSRYPRMKFFIEAVDPQFNVLMYVAKDYGCVEHDLSTEQMK